MFQKIIFPALLLWIFSFWFSHADFKNDDNGRKIAELYLESNKNDDFWKDNSPRLWESTPLYMEKETPSYVEYQVVCERNVDCGFIIVNIDGDDVDIPIASPSDISPSQILTQKSWVVKADLQFYYFSPFDIYSKNTVTNQINAIDPQMDPIEENEILDEMLDVEKKQIKKIIKIRKEELSEIFQTQKKEIVQYKLSAEFQDIKNQIENYGIGINGYPWSVQEWERRYVKWSIGWWCNSKVPCYQQYIYNYSSWPCLFWCSPVAAAIIFGYHDRVDNFPNLFPYEIAPVLNYPASSSVTYVINNIRWHMGTTCDIYGEWTTNGVNVPKADKYAQFKWYTYSKGYRTTGSIENKISKIKFEIDMWRPVVINILKSSWWHSIVWYGYYNPTSNNSSPIPAIRINAGWWNGNTSNADINIYNIFLWNTTRNIGSVVYYHIQ